MRRRDAIKRRNRRIVILGVSVAIAIAGTGGAYIIKREMDIKARCEESRKLTSVAEVHAGSTPAVVLGDSYTQGILLDDLKDGWAYKLAESEGWDAKIDGVGSTGYVNGGPCGDGSFGARISAGAVSSDPEVLVLQGGLNDYREDLTQVESRADSAVSHAKPIKRIVLIGPPKAPARDNLDKIDAVLAKVAKFEQVEYVSALGWDDLEFLPDGVHLTEAGHVRFAAHVADALSR